MYNTTEDVVVYGDDNKTIYSSSMGNVFNATITFSNETIMRVTRSKLTLFDILSFLEFFCSCTHFQFTVESNGLNILAMD